MIKSCTVGCEVCGTSWILHERYPDECSICGHDRLSFWLPCDNCGRMIDYWSYIWCPHCGHFYNDDMGKMEDGNIKPDWEHIVWFLKNRHGGEDENKI